MKNKSLLLTFLVSLAIFNFAHGQIITFSPSDNNTDNSYQRLIESFEKLALKGNIKSIIEIEKLNTLRYADDYEVELEDHLNTTYKFNEANDLVFHKNNRFSYIFENKLTATKTFFGPNAKERVTDFHYDENGLLQKTTSNIGGQTLTVNEFLYDEKNRIITVNKPINSLGINAQDIKYLPDGSFYVASFCFNARHAPINIRHYKFSSFPVIYPSPGSFPSKNEMTVFDEKCVKNVIDYNNLKTKSILVEEWDKDGKLISNYDKNFETKKESLSKLNYDENDRLILKVVDTNGKITKHTTEYSGDKINGTFQQRRQNGALSSSMRNTYNEQGDIITQSSGQTTKFEYKYDHNHNWIERKVIFVDTGLRPGRAKGEKLVSVTTREIIYD